MSGRQSNVGTTPAGEWGDWLAPAAAWERALEAWQPRVMSGEEAPLSGLAGRVLAGDVVAPADSPAFDRSAVDGYAVRVADVASASAQQPARLHLAGEVPMGAGSAVELAPGQAVWVATGSMIPAGADGVVMVERTERVGDDVAVSRPAREGDNIIRRGDDLRAGVMVLPAGRVLRPHDVAALASMGFATVLVRRKPRIAIVAGGDELVAPGQALGPGQIYDSNSFAMAAQVAGWGGEPVILPRMKDRPEVVESTLERAVHEAEVILLSGGSSVGVKDLTAEAIDRVAARLPCEVGASGIRAGVIVHGVAMRPARPTILGVVAGKLVIGIPGNPVSAMIACEAFARPAIEELTATWPRRTAGTMGDYSATGRLAEPVRSQQGRQDYVRVALERGPDGAVVRPVPGGSNAIRSMVAADGIVVVPPERAGLEAGEAVEVRLF